jgi:16S rRNA (guanine527-N7)-methyltransferase
MPVEDGLPRLRELAVQHRLGAEQEQQLALLLSILDREEWAPTAVSSPAEAVDVHVADSLSALELDVVAGAGTIADLGSGAGLPGLVLAVALPATQVWMVESNARKCGFIEATVQQLGLENARVACARAEQWSPGMDHNDVVLARAVAAQAVVLEYAAPLLRLGGSLVDWRGIRDPAQESAADRAATELGLERVGVRSVRPFAQARDRHLHVLTKLSATPERFPRRPGMARKRPLGGPAAP